MDAAVSLIFVAAVATGLGVWFPVRSVGGRLFLGAAAIPAAATLLHFGTGIAVSASLWTASAAAIPGLALLLWRARRPAEILPALLNPACLLAAAAVVVMAIRTPDGYAPYSWDEFASWLFWTKEAFVTDSFLDVTMGWRPLTYTQGWPLALLHPQIVSTTFDEVRSLPVGLFWHAALMGLLYDGIVAHLARTPQVTLRQRRLAAWLLILLLLAAESLWTLLPQLLLIEKPQLFMIAAAFGFLLLGLADAEDPRHCALAAGLTLAAGYLVKVTVVAAVPAVALVVLLPAYRHRCAVRPAAGTDWRVAAGLLLRVLGPFLVAWVLWVMLRPFTSLAACLADPFTIDVSSSGRGPWEHSLDVAMALGAGIAAYLATFKVPLTVVAGAGIAVGLTHRRYAALAAGLIAYGVVYVGALHPLYAFCYGSYELSSLDSMQRYIRVPLRLFHAVGSILLFLWCVETACRRWPAASARTASAAAVTGVLAVLAIVAAGWQLAALDASLRNVVHRDRETPQTVAEIRRTTLQAKALGRLIDRTGMAVPDVLMIAQNARGFELRIARYHSLADRRGAARLRYRLHGEYSFGPAAKNHWMQARTAAEAVAMLRRFDVVWPLIVDPWMRELIARVTDDPACRADPEAYFLVRQRGATPAFACVRKATP